MAFNLLVSLIFGNLHKNSIDSIFNWQHMSVIYGKKPVIDCNTSGMYLVAILMELTKLPN